MKLDTNLKSIGGIVKIGFCTVVDLRLSESIHYNYILNPSKLARRNVGKGVIFGNILFIPNLIKVQSSPGNQV